MGFYCDSCKKNKKEEDVQKQNRNLSSNTESKSKITPDNVNSTNNANNFNGYKCINEIQGHQEKIACVIMLSSGKVASGSYDCTIKIWDIDTSECITTINENGNVFCLLEFENNMLLSGTSSNTIQLWDISSFRAQNLFSFEGHLLWVNCLVKCSNKIFASCSNDHDIRIWNYYERKGINILTGHTDCVLALISLKDGRLCSGSADLTIRIWNWELNSCDMILKGHSKWVKCLCELNNGYIASGSDDKLIKIWFNSECLINLSDHSKSVRTICQLSDGNLASGSFDRTIKIWDVNSFSCIETINAHNGNIITIINFKDGFISCSNDRTIKVWKKG